MCHVNFTRGLKGYSQDTHLSSILSREYSEAGILYDTFKNLNLARY